MKKLFYRSIIGAVALTLFGNSVTLAERWISTRIDSGGAPICIDGDSVQTDSKGFTRFAERMCSSTSSPMYIAVDCQEVSASTEIVQYTYDADTRAWAPRKFSDATVVGIARFVCGRAR